MCASIARNAAKVAWFVSFLDMHVICLRCNICNLFGTKFGVNIPLFEKSRGGFLTFQGNLMENVCLGFHYYSN